MIERRLYRARCQEVGCVKFAQTRGLCKAHGGGTRCQVNGCTKLTQSKGLCISHGGGRRCQAPNCLKLSQTKGFCIAHGGGRKCATPNCGKFSQIKGHCKLHARLLTPTKPQVSTKYCINFLVEPPTEYVAQEITEPSHQTNSEGSKMIKSLPPLQQLLQGTPTRHFPYNKALLAMSSILPNPTQTYSSSRESAPLPLPNLRAKFLNILPSQIIDEGVMLIRAK